MGNHIFYHLIKVDSPLQIHIIWLKLAAVRLDEQGNETSDSSGAFDKLWKVRIMFMFFVFDLWYLLLTILSLIST